MVRNCVYKLQDSFQMLLKALICKLWATFYGLRVSEPFVALKGLKVAAAVCGIEDCSTMVVCMPSVAP